MLLSLLRDNVIVRIYLGSKNEFKLLRSNIFLKIRQTSIPQRINSSNNVSFPLISFTFIVLISFCYWKISSYSFTEYPTLFQICLSLFLHILSAPHGLLRKMRLPYFRSTQRLISLKYLFEEVNITFILPRIFYSLRTAEDFKMTVLFMYNFRSLSNKFPTIF